MCAFLYVGNPSVTGKAGKTDWKGRLSTDLFHVLSSLDQVLSRLKIYFLFFIQKGKVNEEVIHTELFLSVRFPWKKNQTAHALLNLAKSS
jgi:hypothetical protein